MKYIKRPSIQSSPLTALVLTTLWTVSACSGSSDSVSDETQPSVGSTTPVVVIDSDNNVSNDVALEDVVPETELPTDQINDGSDGAAQNETVDSNPIVQDPLIENRIIVTFDITVPAYQSNALSLEVILGETNLAAAWVGDEIWTVSLDAPTATELSLVMTFSDNNGDLTLATYESTYRTGINASESVQVNAALFDSGRWDADNDGISNLEELIAGTDPLLDERMPLEIRDSFDLFSVNRLSKMYESVIPADRPFFMNTGTSPEEFLRPYSIRINTLDIDENGNARYVNLSEFQGLSDSFGDSDSGTRTHSGDSVTWVGRSSSFDTGSGRRDSQQFTIETTFIDESTRQQDAVQVIDNCCATFRFAQDFTYSLTGVVIENSKECAPIAGTLLSETTAFILGNSTLVTSASKALDDEFWRVSVTRDDIVEEEFFARTIDTTFYCDFSDLNTAQQ